MRVIVGGTHTFDNYDLLKKALDKLLPKVGVTILSAHNPGTDRMGEKYAFERMLPYQIYHLDPKLKDKDIPTRNEEMARNADAAILFWDRGCRQTGNLIMLLKKHKIKLRVIRYKELK